MKITFPKIQQQAKLVGGSLGAFVYETMVADPVVSSTVTNDSYELTASGWPKMHMNPMGAVVQMAAGWGPFIAASLYPSPAMSAFAGGVGYRRIEQAIATLREVSST